MLTLKSDCICIEAGQTSSWWNYKYWMNRVKPSKMQLTRSLMKSTSHDMEISYTILWYCRCIQCIFVNISPFHYDSKWECCAHQMACYKMGHNLVSAYIKLLICCTHTEIGVWLIKTQKKEQKNWLTWKRCNNNTATTSILTIVSARPVIIVFIIHVICNRN